MVTSGQFFMGILLLLAGMAWAVTPSLLNVVWLTVMLTLFFLETNEVPFPEFRNPFRKNKENPPLTDAPEGE